MKCSRPQGRQAGITLPVGLILLVVITILVSSSFVASRNALTSVGNMQFREEAIAAGNLAMETVINSPFTTAPAAETINVDLNNDGSTDYVVAFALPTCVSATSVSAPVPSSLSLPDSMSLMTTWEVLWDLNATVTSVQQTGASITLHEGVRVFMTDAQKIAVCP
ncbi:MAG: hypothetical protein RJA36_210 [Pseudomonadota bacterium]|jgi:Tfp pilus assembly protein PilX